MLGFPSYHPCPSQAEALRKKKPGKKTAELAGAQRRQQQQEAGRATAQATENRTAPATKAAGQGGDNQRAEAEAARKAQRDRWDGAIALFVGFAAAAERTQAQLGEQIVRSLLHGEPELGAGVGC